MSYKENLNPSPVCPNTSLYTESFGLCGNSYNNYTNDCSNSYNNYVNDCSNSYTNAYDDCNNNYSDAGSCGVSYNNAFNDCTNSYSNSYSYTNCYESAGATSASWGDYSDYTDAGASCNQCSDSYSNYTNCSQSYSNYTDCSDSYTNYTNCSQSYSNYTNCSQSYSNYTDCSQSYYNYTNTCSVYVNYSNHTDYARPNTGVAQNLTWNSNLWSTSGLRLKDTYDAMIEMRDNIDKLNDTKGQHVTSDTQFADPTLAEVQDEVEALDVNELISNINILYDNIAKGTLAKGVSQKSSGVVVTRTDAVKLKDEIDGLAESNLTALYSNAVSYTTPATHNYTETRTN